MTAGWAARPARRASSDRLSDALGIDLRPPPAARDQLLEPVDVPLADADGQPVRAPLGLQPPVRAEYARECRHLVVEHLVNRRGRRISPQIN
jgi:hypothetical protein